MAEGDLAPKMAHSEGIEHGSMLEWEDGGDCCICFVAELGAQKGPKMGSWGAFVDACGHHGADPPPPAVMERFHIFRRVIAPAALHSAGNGRRNH